MSGRTRELTPRERLAIVATRTTNAVSRRLGVGAGTVAGGRAGLALAPHLLASLTRGRTVALVSGTNGKTTTTRLLAAALEAHGGPVVTNATGSNMPPGHVAALAAGRPAVPVVLEVDEGYVASLVSESRPAVVILLNLSRDQLDRTNEVRMVANRWRAALEGGAVGHVVANADDPLVAWGAGTAGSVTWVAAGLRWTADASGCPSCEGRIVFSPSTVPSADAGWACTCGFARPRPDVTLTDTDGQVVVTLADGRCLRVALGIPGRFNQANAAMAAVAAEHLGVPVDAALGAMAGVEGVAGRFSVRVVDGVPTRLMLAKNPAGWAELLDLVCPGSGPVVVSINARIADGRDPSWLWDVPFERLGGRTVVATGERCRDLSVRLHYAEVEHRTEPDPRRAVVLAGSGGARATEGAAVDFIGNYTAFHDLWGRP